ncbi:DUF389 domain-containing protein [Nocardioides sp. CFH 31398]|uniref:DUF389 domain-containing protein n=1 Tax=Nocardioides sp. CFH 31398 TaxID=2919579 RepID=UPI001F05DBF2|nr:DUF389 domain-containing protein [Nocardioides sp. CFH 31398]MCH1865611.1 DUF389 domain-containing protein [Nocardioides sp. CFH 31398]
MLHVRLTAPHDLAEQALARVRDDPTVVHLVALRGVVLDCDGDLLTFDLARENANAVLGDLRAMGVEQQGSLRVDEAETLMSYAADRAEELAPGEPVDAVIWDAVEERAAIDARWSWSFLAFMVLATLIASVGRYLDQPILIVGAMVVGPEFAPLACVCFALARRSWGLIGPATGSLAGAVAAAAVVTYVVWQVADLAGVVDRRAATTGDLTEFIVAPDVWSFVVAVLAGVAGVLSLTASKSSTLVGVFISVTTVPAIGTLGLTLAVGAWGEAWSSVLQLAINVAGIVLAGTLTLAVQSAIWRPGRPGPREARRSGPVDAVG